jgi:hypothetical protein
MITSVDLKFCENCGYFMGFYIGKKQYDSWEDILTLLLTPVLRYKYDGLCEVCSRNK